MPQTVFHHTKPQVTFQILSEILDDGLYNYCTVWKAREAIGISFSHTIPTDLGFVDSLRDPIGGLRPNQAGALADKLNEWADELDAE